MQEFVNKLGVKIEFTPSFLSWLSGINESNHYNCDVIVRKIMEEHKFLKEQWKWQVALIIQM